MVKVKESHIHGFGLFATEKIKNNTIILASPCINIEGCRKNYKHAFVIDAKNIMIALDRASLINGSDNPNVEHYFENDILKIKSIKNIDVGEEIFLKYFV